MKQVLPEWGFIFCWRFKRHLFGHMGFRRFKISEKIFLKNPDFRHHRKMYRLSPCIPIFRWFFLFKVQKECVYVNVLKIAFLLFKIYVLMLKKGISRLLSWIAAKHTANLLLT